MIKWLYQNIGNIQIDLSTYVTNTIYHTIEMRRDTTAMPNQSGIIGWEQPQCDVCLIRTYPSTTPAGGTGQSLNCKGSWKGTGATQYNIYMGNLNATSGATIQALSNSMEEIWKLWNNHPNSGIEVLAPEIDIMLSHDRTSGIIDVDYMIGVRL